MADQAITDYTVTTTPHGDILFETVDLRESLTSAQNKKVTLATLFNNVVCYNNAVVCSDDEIVFNC